MNIVEYNECLRKRFEETNDINILLRYVMTEALAPICDYEHMIQIIRNYKDTYQNPTLLILGAYYLSYWFHEQENDLLEDLNRMKERMTSEELAITYYLNAFHIQSTHPGFAKDPEYRKNLLLSIGYNVPFVNNRMLLAEISPLEEKQTFYVEALRNVIHVNTYSEIKSTPDEAYAEPDQFIGEFITGTHPNAAHYSQLLEDALQAFNEG